MAAEADHIALANRNDAALRYLLAANPSDPEWVVTVAFYKAVHVVEAVFAHKRGWHSISHDWRLTTLKGLNEFKPIFKPFRTLYGYSRAARYLEDTAGAPISSFSSVLPDADIEPKIIKGLLKTIEDNSVGMLSAACKSALVRV